MKEVKIVPVILCGGSGTRLWPASREAFPKQFLTLVGDSSLLQQTMQRALRVADVGADHLVTVTLGALKGEVDKQLGDMQTAAVQHVLSEPSARNTGAAVALAAEYVAETFGPESIMWILPADHHMSDENALAYALNHGVKAAQQDYMVTFGIQPTRPDTGYGYIRSGKELSDGITCRVEEFVEKPDMVTAQSYVDSDDYLWNSGMFVFTAEAILNQFETHAPNILNVVRNAMHAGSAKQPLANIYASIEDQPFDKAIMEKTSMVAVVPCNPGWSDIGSWESLWELRAKDENGNVLDGRVFCEDSHDCLIEATDSLIACAGLRDVVIIETGDALLVADRNHPDAMKRIVKSLRQAGAREVIQPPMQSQLDQIYQVHEYDVASGQPLQLMVHDMAQVSLVVLEGLGQVVIGNDSQKLAPGFSIFLPNDIACIITSASEHPLKLLQVAKPQKNIASSDSYKKKVA